MAEFEMTEEEARDQAELSRWVELDARWAQEPSRFAQDEFLWASTLVRLLHVHRRSRQTRCDKNRVVLHGHFEAELQHLRLLAQVFPGVGPRAMAVLDEYRQMIPAGGLNERTATDDIEIAAEFIAIGQCMELFYQLKDGVPAAAQFSRDLAPAPRGADDVADADAQRGDSSG